MIEKLQNQPNFEKAKAHFEEYSQKVEQIAQNIILKIPEWKKVVAENPNSLVVIDIDGTVFYDLPRDFRLKNLYLPVIPQMKKVILELQKNNIPLIFVTGRSLDGQNLTVQNLKNVGLNIPDNPDQIMFCGHNHDEYEEFQLQLEGDKYPGNTRKGLFFNRLEKNFKIIAAVGNARSDILWRRSQIDPDDIEKGFNRCRKVSFTCFCPI